MILSKSKAIIGIVVLCVILSSCTKFRCVTCNSYIRGYYKIEKVSLTPGSVTLESGEEYYKIIVDYNKITWLSSVFHTTRNDNGMYEQYCIEHNDVSYVTRRFRVGRPDNYSEECYPAYDFVEIDVTTSYGWDESHPEGSSLNDMTEFAALSVQPFISSGYKECDYESVTLTDFFLEAFYPISAEYGTSPWYPVQKKLSEMSSGEFSLLGDGHHAIHQWPQICCLYLPKSESADRHKVTVSLKVSNGDVLSSTVELD